MLRTRAQTSLTSSAKSQVFFQKGQPSQTSAFFFAKQNTFQNVTVQPQQEVDNPPELEEIQPQTKVAESTIAQASVPESPLPPAEPLPLVLPQANGTHQPTIQAKFTLGKPNDSYEQEADRVAHRVVGGGSVSTAPPIQAESTYPAITPSLQCAPPTNKSSEFEAAIAGASQAAIDVTFYSGDPFDPNYETSKTIAESRYKKGETNLAAPISQIEDIHTILQTYAYLNDLVSPSRKQEWEQKQNFFLVPDNHPGFVRKISIIGHGTAGKKGKEPFYGFGSIAYKTSELREMHSNGLSFSRYMVNNGKVVLEGCEAAAGPPGKQFLLQVGQIFFGSGKKGIVRGNTGKSVGFAGEMMGGGAIEFNWPADFINLDIPCDPLEAATSGFMCVPKGKGFVLAEASTSSTSPN